MKAYLPLTRLVFALCMLLVPSLACDLTFVRDILARIDTTPTSCVNPVFTVTLLTDFNDGHCNSQCSLREAIQAANDCPGDNVVQLGAGTYTLQTGGSGDDRGDLNINSNMTIVGVSTLDTIVSPGRSWDNHILNIAAGVTAHINGLTISGSDLVGGQGGGILNAGNLTLENAALQNNTAWTGGGLFNTGTAHLTNVDVTNNTALADFSIGRGGYWLPYPDGASSSDCGGGIANTGTLQVTGGNVSHNSAYIGAGICNALGATLTIGGTTISANGTAWGTLPALGGGIATFSGLTVSAATISENRAQLGGGLYILAPGPTEISLDDVTVQDNHAADDGGGSSTAANRNGGGLYVKSGTLTIVHSRIIDNHSAGSGAGISIEPGSGSRDGIHTELGPDYEAVHGIIRQSSIARNIAGAADGIGNGGGINYNKYFGLYGSSSLELENVTISSNQAHGIGGAFYLKYIFGGARLTNVTVANNWAQTTSGIDADENSRLYLKNSLIALNRPWNCRVEGGGQIISEGYNMSEGNLCNLTATGDVDDISSPATLETTLSEVSNQFVHHLLPGAQAVDWINPTRCPAVDQLGTARPQGLRCDVGAYELSTTVLSLEVTPLAFPTPSATPLAIIPRLAQNANCRKGPGTAYDIVTAFEKGLELQPLARNEQNTWLQVSMPNGGACWLADSTLEKPGAPDGLPVLTAPALPAAPATFSDKATCAVQQKKMSVRLSWSAVPNASGYHIYRDGTLIASPGTNVTVFEQDGLPLGHGLTYEIEAFNANGVSARLATTVSACK